MKHTLLEVRIKEVLTDLRNTPEIPTNIMSFTKFWAMLQRIVKASREKRRNISHIRQGENQLPRKKKYELKMLRSP